MPISDGFEILQVNSTSLAGDASDTMNMDIGFMGTLVALTHESTGAFTIEMKVSDGRVVIPANSHHDAVLGSAQRPFFLIDPRLYNLIEIYKLLGIAELPPWLRRPGLKVTNQSSLEITVTDTSSSTNNIYINGLFVRDS